MAMRRTQRLPELRGFFPLLVDAFAYPIRGQGKSLIIGGALFFWIISIFFVVPFIGLILAVLMGGYMCALMFRVIGYSTKGDPDPPGWVDFTDVQSGIIQPLLLVLGTVALCLLPWIILALGESLADWRPGIAKPIALWVGLLYLPMALLAVSLAEVMSALNPLVIVPSIVRVPLEYGAVCAVLALIYALQTVAGTYVFGRIPVAGSLLSYAVSLYAVMLEMRILGILYYTNEHTFGWFDVA